MFGRILRFLFAPPVALAATAGLVSCATAPAGANSFFRGDVESQSTLSIDDRDAPPKVRIPPQYPRKCFASAKPKEMVFVEFDVTPEGVVENARVVDSTNPCFNKSAIASVLRWRYKPATDPSGEPRWRRGVQTYITYELAN